MHFTQHFTVRLKSLFLSFFSFSFSFLFRGAGGDNNQREPIRISNIIILDIRCTVEQLLIDELNSI